MIKLELTEQQLQTIVNALAKEPLATSLDTYLTIKKQIDDSNTTVQDTE